MLQGLLACVAAQRRVHKSAHRRTSPDGSAIQASNLYAASVVSVLCGRIGASSAAGLISASGKPVCNCDGTQQK